MLDGIEKVLLMPLDYMQNNLHKLNAEALLAFSSTMAATAPLGTVAAIGDLFTGII